MSEPASLIITALEAAIALASVLAVVLIMVLIFKIALRARHAKRGVCDTGILGLKGRTVTPVAPEGTVFVRNELWRARANVNIDEGESIRVTGLDGLTLKVEPVKDYRETARQALATKVRSN